MEIEMSVEITAIESSSADLKKSDLISVKCYMFDLEICELMTEQGDWAG